VLDATERDFNPVLDVRTESDGPHSNAKAKSGRRKRVWPTWTNLAQASTDDVRGKGVLVGVLDTGIDADHSEFKRTPIEFRYVPPSAIERSDSIRNVRGFDTDGHGTHVCWIIAGGRHGVARAVNLHVAAVIESETFRTSLWRTVYGLNWMFRLFTEPRNFDVPCVINLSLCFFEDLMEEQEVKDWKLILGRAIEDLDRKDALIVAAAGNRGSGFLGFPARFDNVVAVGAVDENLQIAPFSGGPTGDARRDIYGLGVDVHSAFERDRDGRSSFRPLNGTSMAAPYVAGIAASGARAPEVRKHLMDTAISGQSGVPVARFRYWNEAS
jgi:subtilisin family serine protease